MTDPGVCSDVMPLERLYVPFRECFHNAPELEHKHYTLRAP